MNPPAGWTSARKPICSNRFSELAEGGVGVLLASSEMSELTENCDLIWVMHEGRNIAALRPENHTTGGYRSPCGHRKKRQRLTKSKGPAPPSPANPAGAARSRRAEHHRAVQSAVHLGRAVRGRFHHSPQFLTSQNPANLLQQSSLTGIVAIGMTVVILTSGIDLSVGSAAALSEVAGGDPDRMWESPGRLPCVLAILSGLVLGGIMGGLERLPRAAGLHGDAGRDAEHSRPDLLDHQRHTDYRRDSHRPSLPGCRIGRSIPVVGLIFVITTVIVGLVLRRTTFGEHVYAVGSNAKLPGCQVCQCSASPLACVCDLRRVGRADRGPRSPRG